MTKLVKIERCADCPHFYESLVMTEEMTCNKLKIVLTRGDIIHEDCPLEDVPELPLYLVYEFSHSSVGSWNGKWSGEGNYYAVVKNLGTSEIKTKHAERILAGSPYVYNFGDGWVAEVTVRQVRDAKEASRLRYKSVGFCGYEWMILSIEAKGRIDPD